MLDARAKYPIHPCGPLDPLAMPPELVKAHKTLDRAVDAAYEKKGFSSDAEPVSFLFERYQELIAPLMAKEKTGNKGRKKIA